MKFEEKTIVWRGISVIIRCNPDYSNAYRKHYGCGLAHLEVFSQNREKLPISETGYASRFFPQPNIASYGGIESIVKWWLEEEARKPGWKNREDLGQQLSLF